MSRRDTKLDHYARAIEQRWTELLDRPVVLSASDWDLIVDWHTRRIPLQLIDECMQATVKPDRGGRPRQPKGLSYVAPGVEEAWRVVVDGRVAGQGDAEEPGEDAVASWRARAAAAEPRSPLGELLQDLLDRLDAGAEHREVDRDLDRSLPEVAPRVLRDDLLGDLDRELGRYRARMTAERLESTRRQALVERLRRRLGLPRLGRDAPPRRASASDG